MTLYALFYALRDQNKIHIPKTLKGIQTCFSIAFNNHPTNPFAVFIHSPWTLAILRVWAIARMAGMSPLRDVGKA